MASSLLLRKLLVHPAAISPSSSLRLFQTESSKFVESTSGNFTRCNFKESDDSMKIWIGLPGLTKEDIKLTVNKNTVSIKFDVSKNSLYKEAGWKCPDDVDIPMPQVFKVSDLKAEVKNGMLKLILPKI